MPQMEAILPLSDLDDFYFFFLPIALPRTSSLMLNKSGKREHPCLLLILQEMFSIFYYYVVSCGLVINGLYYVEAYYLPT